MVIRGYDKIADAGGPNQKWEDTSLTGVFLVNLSYISIFSFSFAYYRASTLLQMENNYKSKIELSNFLQNQDKKDRIYNVATISSIIILSALQAICSG